MTALLVLAWRHLRSHGARVALAAGGVACGVALVVAIHVVNASTLAAFTDAIEDLAGTAALQVRGPGPFSEAVAEQLRTLPGIDHAVPIITATFFGVDPPLADEALAVFAVDVTDGHAIRTLRLVNAGDRVVDDPLSFLVDPHSIVVTDSLAERLGIESGAKVRLRTPGGLDTFTVRGVLPPGGAGRAFGGNLVLMDVIGAQVVLGLEGQIHQVDLALTPGTRVDDAEREVGSVLHGGLHVLRPARRGEQIERYLASFQALLSGLSGLALLAAIFLIGSAVATSVASRREELSLLRCIGGQRRQVARLVFADAVTIGGVGSVLGVPLGLLLARLLLRTVGDSTELIFSMKVFAADLEVSPGILALGVVTGVAAALLAAWVPVREAVAVSPLASLGRARITEPVQRWRLNGPMVVALALTGAGLWAETRFDSPWSGNLAMLAADFVLVLLFMRVAGRVALVVLGPVRPVLGFSGRLAVNRLVEIPDQLALAAAVLALGVGLMITSATLARSFEESVLGFIARQVRADLVVASTATTGWVEAPLPETVAERLLTIPGVARVERLRLAEHEYRGTRISVDSLDETAFAPERAPDFTFVGGDPQTALAAVRTATGVLVSQNLARRFEIRLGAVLHLDTPAGPLAARVAGIVVDYVSPHGSIILSRPLYRRWWQDSSANRFHVTLAPEAAVERSRRAIAEAFRADERVKILTQRELYRYHQDAVRRAFRLTLAVEWLPFIVAALGLAQALLAVSLDRRREFALLRVAGATRSQVARAVVAESAAVGVLGLVGGVAIGVVLAVMWVKVNFVHQLGWQIDFHFAGGSIPAAAAAALLVSVPAGLLPARRVARLQLLDALRQE